MGFGSTEKILRVDLTRSAVNIEEIDRNLYRLYPGGKALAAYILLRELPRDTDPLSPANILILANGVLTGAPVSTATRFTAVARSPLTGAYGESEAGGFWGPELKFAGFEAIVVTGRAAQPVYLWVRDGHAEIRNARHLWGHDPDEVQATLRQELSDKLVRVLQIGLGGENQVRYAAITNELRHFNGRTGMGAVMGSKNLKAIAVRGTGRYADVAHDPLTLAELGRKLAKQVRDHPISWDLQVRGTPGVVESLNASGILPTRNFTTGVFEGVDRIKWEAYEKELLTGRRSCYACAVRCKREVAANGRYQVNGTYGGPEYEAIGGFGSNCGVDDLQAVAKANELCNRYTLDVISTSDCVAFAMECFEHELIGGKETGGIDLRFGNADAMLQTVEWIARREGLGAMLAEGVKRAAEAIGGEARAFALHVKGQELPLHDIRGKAGLGLSYAVSEVGAEHVSALHDPMLANPGSVALKGAQPLGITEPLGARDLSHKKVEYFSVLENWSSAGKVIGLCYFGPAPRSFIQVDDVLSIIHAAMGWQMSPEDLLRIGERATNLARMFNVRHGLTRRDDALPDRVYTPLPTGALAGVAYARERFEQALTELYTIKGWDPETAIPTRERLCDLGIEWAANQ